MQQNRKLRQQSILRFSGIMATVHLIQSVRRSLQRRTRDKPIECAVTVIPVIVIPIARLAEVSFQEVGGGSSIASPGLRVIFSHGASNRRLSGVKCRFDGGRLRHDKFFHLPDRQARPRRKSDLPDDGQIT
jgi:hypothetical protein